MATRKTPRTSNTRAPAGAERRGAAVRTAKSAALAAALPHNANKAAEYGAASALSLFARPGDGSIRSRSIRPWRRRRRYCGMRS
jgi:hypothetical protein